MLSDPDYVEELGIVTDELIDQYARGRLSKNELHEAERFVFELPERRRKLRFALALKKRALEKKSEQRLLRSTWRVYLPIAASLLVVFGLAGWFIFLSPSEIGKGLTALRAAYRDQRPLDARVTDFNYAPLLRGETKVDSVQRELAARLLLNADSNPNAQSKHALGQYYLTERRFSEAIEQLEASLRFDNQNAKAHSDLGVALLEAGKLQGESGESLTFFARSHEHLKKALALDDRLLEARYNLALLQEQMRVPYGAEEAWRDYLNRDSSSPWANEARQHLDALEQRRPGGRAQNGSPLLDNFLDAYRNRDDAKAWRLLSENREVVAHKFMPVILVEAYLQHANAQRTNEAAGMLDALGYAGELESDKVGDLYTAELAGFYRSHAPAHLVPLTRANALAVEGYELCRRSGFADAITRFKEAQQIFTSVGNVAEADFVGYWLALSSFYEKRTVEDAADVNDVIRDCHRRRFKWLLAQALGLLSNIKTSSQEQSAVLELSRQALQLSEEVNDIYGTQKYLASLAGKYSVVSNFSESLALLARCLRLANDFWPGDRQAWRNYDTATQVFNRMGLYSASAVYGEEALRLVLQGSKDPSLIYLSHVHLGMAYGRLDNSSDGIKLAESGLAIGKSIPGNTGKEIMAYSGFQLGELYRQSGSFAEAISHYKESIGLYDQLSFQTFKFVAHRGLFLAYLAQGDDAGAAAELKVVLEIFDTYREKIKEEDNRTYFFDAAQELYDAAIEFTHSRLRNDEAAFEHAENSSARSLLATMLSASGSAGGSLASKPYSLAEIRSRMPEDVQIIQYSVLPDRVLTWVITKNGFAVNEKLISRQTLNEHVQNFLRLVTRPSSAVEDVQGASAVLYDVLIRPIHDKLASGKTLCIVPDKVLNHVPFAALFSRETGRYLIEDHALLCSPSSTVFVINTEMALNKPTPANEKLLSVGNPTFDRAAFPSLSDLRSAATEAQAIALFYKVPTPTVLIGPQANKEQVVKNIANADVLHFASHYVVDEHNPMRSQLLLAKPEAQVDQSNFGGGALSAGDIYSMKLTRPRVAILSACSTGVERYYNGEGMIGMARTFLAAGVPMVIASQWPVDSAATSDLMIKFHEYRTQRRVSTVAALRAVQTESFNSKSYPHPYYWAAFVTIGGYASF